VINPPTAEKNKTLQTLYNCRITIDEHPAFRYYDHIIGSNYLPSSPPKADPSVIHPEGFALLLLFA
jgi:hypothetical protein